MRYDEGRENMELSAFNFLRYQDTAQGALSESNALEELPRLKIIFANATPP